MKSKTLIALLFFSIYIVNIILLSSCNSSTELKESQRLLIEDGYYSKVETSNLTNIQYKVEFVYFVKGEECNWGGYHIQMDSESWNLDLYKMQLLKPDEKHFVVDTFKVNSELKTNPIVTMQGYKIGSSESYESLKAECTLKLKPKKPNT